MSVFEKEKITIPIASPVRSLCWDGDELVDWAGGGIRFSLEGKQKPANVYYPYRFDRAIVHPCTEFTILYEVLGTKALVLRDAKQLREINRSYYFASSYEYPVIGFLLPDGTPALAHCPEEYNQIQIDEIESGRRLSPRSTKAIDFFHSRLQVSPNGKYLISAGWVWHPLDAVQIFEVAAVLREPELLDIDCSLETPALFEIHSVAFQSEDVLLYTGSSSEEDKPTSLLSGFNMKERTTTFTRELKDIPGTLMPVGLNHVIGFFDNPKLFELNSGKIIHSWPDLKTGKQNSSIIHHLDGKIPPLAIDASATRFAVADKKQITVIQLAEKE